MKSKRYSNYDPYTPPIIIATNPDGSVYTGPGTGSNLGQNSSGSGVFDWGGFANNLMNTTSSVLSSIFSPSYKYEKLALDSMYKAEKRTNTILWIVIGLVLALGVFLVIRKTK